jgi:ADP-ribosylglycohydrolase
MAVNLAGQASIIGSVYGQLAGTYYGASQIPPKWCTFMSKFDDFQNIITCLIGIKPA